MNVILLLLLFFAAPVPPQEDPAALRALVEASGLGDAERAALGEQLDLAETLLQKSTEQDTRAREFEDLSGKAANDLANVQAELDAAPRGDPAPLPGGSDVAAHEAEVRTAQAKLDEAEARVQALEAEKALREQRAREVPPILARLETEIQQLNEALGPELPADLPGRVQRARLQARLRASLAEQAALEAELESYAKRRDLLPKRKARWESRALSHTQDLSVWNVRLSEARESESAAALERATELAREEVAQNEKIAEWIGETQEFIEQASEAAEQAEDAKRDRAKTEQDLEELEQRIASLKVKLDVVGLTDEMGQQLLAEYKRLRAPRQLARERRGIERAYATAEFRRIDLAEVTNALDVELEKQSLIEAVLPTTPPKREAVLRAVVSEAVDGNVSRREALLGLVTEIAENRLIQLRVHDQFAGRTGLGRRFAEERVLYVRSVKGARLPSPSEAFDALTCLISEPAWGAAVRSSLRDSGRSPLGWFLLLLGAVLLLFGGRIGRLLTDTGAGVRRYRTDRMASTGAAALATVALAAPKPMLLAGTGLVLASTAEPASTVAALGAALVRVAVAFAPVYLLRALVRKDGLADAHLKWPSDGCRAVRRGLLWFVPITLPAVAVALVFQDGETPRFQAFDESLGRPAAWVAFAALGVLSHRLLRRDGPLLGPWLRRSDGIVARTHTYWRGLVVAAPWALLIASALGYHYTVVRFSVAYRGSLTLVLGVLVGRGLITRWRSFTRRRLAVEQARQRAEARAAQDSEATSESAGIDEDSVDIPAVDAQTRRVFDTLAASVLALGLYLTWSGLLPALSVLDRVQVFPHLAILEESQLDETGEVPDAPAASAFAAEPAGSEEPNPALPLTASMATVEPESSETPSSVTLADLLAALVFLGITALLAQNIPGVLEFTLLVRLPLDAGARYAFTTLVRYVIVLVGLTVSMRAVGIGWNSVQWLAAALTFGLAFGLQEIFANFVSGVILLLERPLRVGDFVTVDGVEGQVTRLRMRATTITDWDNRELLVPNKQFITASLVNWTLTDTVTRFVIPVGVAYGSDVRRAEEVLLEVARAAENVLDKPEPSVVFREFADSSLTLELRVYLPHRDVWPGVVSALHFAVDDAFREAGIEIAFPQRDLHLRSIDPAAAKHLGGSDPG